ncbi:MAG TPA: hypothetical protein VIO43_05180 [Lutibacter sp.]
MKGLKKENLRDNMTNTELILNMLAEASTKDISQAINPKNFIESQKVAQQGGNKTVAKEQFQFFRLIREHFFINSIFLSSLILIFYCF